MGHYYDQIDDQPECDSVKTRFRSYWQQRRRAHDGEHCISCEHWEPQTRRFNSELGTCQLFGPANAASPCHSFRGGAITDWEDGCAHYHRRWMTGAPATDDQLLAIVSTHSFVMIAKWDAVNARWREATPRSRPRTAAPDDARWQRIRFTPTQMGGTKRE